VDDLEICNTQREAVRTIQYTRGLLRCGTFDRVRVVGKSRDSRWSPWKSLRVGEGET
jgi:hypothetical protein